MQSLLGHRKKRFVFVLTSRGGWWEGFQEEEGGPGGMCRGKSRGLRGELQGARSGEGDGGGWSEKQGQGESA